MLHKPSPKSFLETLNHASSRHKMYGSCIFGDNFVGKKVGLRTYKTSRPPENQGIRGIFVLSSFEIWIAKNMKNWKKIKTSRWAYIAVDDLIKAIQLCHYMADLICGRTVPFKFHKKLKLWEL
jgi:hypothetical protein